MFHFLLLQPFLFSLILLLFHLVFLSCLSFSSLTVNSHSLIKLSFRSGNKVKGSVVLDPQQM